MSCQHALTGDPCYRFNAATPGVPPEVVREVERITADEEPPGHAALRNGAGSGARPARLCFSGGRATILASVVFVPTDFSDCPGGSLAHALVTATPDADLGELLPIEAWRAPWWASAPDASTSLPPLTGPLPPGPIDRDGVQAFLDQQPAATSLPALLTAAARSVAGGSRSVVLVSADAEDSARWIAAISYLLPEPLARRMSFTTYHRRPRYCPLHVIGTLPDAEADWERADAERLLVFDLVGGHGPADVHPLAELLAAVGPVAAKGMWRQASQLAHGAAGFLDEWYGPAAAAAAMTGVRLSPLDLDVAIRWFTAEAELRRLDVPLAASVAESLLARAEDDETRLRAVISAARMSGAGSRLGEGLDGLEVRLVEAEVARVAAGLDAVPAPEIGSTPVRDRARRHCETRLATADAGVAVALLRWARRAGVTLGGEALAACGERLGVELSAQAEYAETREAAAGWPALRRGVAARLARMVIEDPDAAQRSFDRAIDGLLHAEDLSVQPRLRELWLVHQAGTEPGRRAAAFAAVLAGRAQRHEPAGVPDLLRRLWPEGWSSGDARRALETVDGRTMPADGIVEWLADALLRPPEAGDAPGWHDYRRLCRAAAAHPVRPLLPDQAGQVLGWADRLEDADRLASASPARATDLVAELGGWLREAPPVARGLLVHHLPELLWRSEVARLAEVLPECPRDAVAGYLERARPALRGLTPDPTLGADLFLAGHALDAAGHPHGELLLQGLLAALPLWSRRDLDALLTRLEARDFSAAVAFVRWRERQAPAGLRAQVTRLLRRGVGSRTPDA